MGGRGRAEGRRPLSAQELLEDKLYQPQPKRYSDCRDKQAHGFRIPWPGGDASQRLLLCHEALDGLVQIVHALGADHIDLAISLTNLAILMARQGKYADSEPLFQRALTIEEKGLGQDHPRVALANNNLAIAYKLQGKYEEAEPLYRRALEIQEKVLGPKHPDVARSLNNLANLYLEQDRYQDAEPLYRQSLEISEEVLGPEHPDVGPVGLLGALGDRSASGAYRHGGRLLAG